MGDFAIIIRLKKLLVDNKCSNRSINELKEAIQMRFNLPPDSFHILIQIQQYGPSSEVSSDWLRKKLEEGSKVNKIKNAREIVTLAMKTREVKGCEVILTGQFKAGARAKLMKFKDGYMIF